MLNGELFMRFLLIIGFLWTTSLVSAANNGTERKVIFREDWNSGAKIFSPDSLTGTIGLAMGMYIDPDKWIVNIGQKSDDSKCQLEQLGTGDWAVFTEGPSIEEGNDHSTWFYSRQAFQRGRNLSCTFKTWVDPSKKDNWVNGSPVYAQVGGPWHSGREGPVLHHPEAVVRYWNTPCFAQAGDAWPLGGHAMSPAFVNASQSSITKDKALTIRVWLGDETGAMLEWSADNGENWTQESDTRGTSGGRHSEVYLGFATYGAAVFIDDIIVESDAGAGTR
jgi:hypothetical protein